MEFLVRRMHPIVRQRKAHQDSRDAEQFLKETDRRNRATRAQKDRRRSKTPLVCCSRGADCWMVTIYEHRLGSEVPTNRWSHSRRCGTGRSEEHTSELQSLRHLVCRLLLEK